MKEIILAKCGELVLKGLNRISFEKTLVKNLKISLRDFAPLDISVAQSTIYISKEEDYDIDTAFGCR